MSNLTDLPVPASARTPSRARNRRSPFAVGGTVPRGALLTLAALGFILPCAAWIVISLNGWVD
ncbi:MAG: hypothetical protein ABIQ08_04850, partial [Duganella sp.]